MINTNSGQSVFELIFEPNIDRMSEILKRTEHLDMRSRRSDDCGGILGCDVASNCRWMKLLQP
jgi:hypothetical protein